MADKIVKVEVDWMNLFHIVALASLGALFGAGVNVFLLEPAFSEEDPSGRVTCYNGGEVMYTSVAQYEGGGTYIETESRDRVIVSGDCIFREGSND